MDPLRNFGTKRHSTETMYQGGQMNVNEINRLEDVDDLAIFLTQSREVKVGLVVRFIQRD